MRTFASLLAIVVATLGLPACKPACGAESRAVAGESVSIAHLPDARPKPKPKSPCGSTAKDGKSKLWGANGTKVISKTLASGVVGQYKYRIDVENPAPGKRAGSLHVQLGGRGSTHYEYRRGGKFYTRDGEPLPKQVQRAIDKSPKAQAGIREGLRYLGEK